MTSAAARLIRPIDAASLRSLIDAHASARIDRRLRLSLRAENLFDARVEATLSERGEIERATPRALWAELGFSL